jgi:hypothetical protein
MRVVVLKCIVLPVLLLACSVPCYLQAGSDDFTGIWVGSHFVKTGTIPVFHDELVIEKTGGSSAARLEISAGLTPRERQLISDDGQPPGSEWLNTYAWLCIQEMSADVQNGSLLLRPTLWRPLFGRNAKPVPVILELRPDGNGRLEGTSTPMDTDDWVYGSDDPENHRLEGFVPDESRTVSVVFERKGRNGARPPLRAERGTTTTLACLDAPGVTYSCYIPVSYDESKPACIIVNDSPKNRAKPFAVAAADELGWISAGLPGEYDATSFLVIRDAKRRFGMAPRGLYLAGFSEGARRNAYRSLWYRGEVGGVVDVDMGAVISTSRTDPEIPVCLLRANRNGSKDELVRYYLLEGLPAGFRWAVCLTYDAGHTWGPRELHNKAVRWLAGIRRESGFMDLQ